jgi:hypothetical protein
MYKYTNIKLCKYVEISNSKIPEYKVHYAKSKVCIFEQLHTYLTQFKNLGWDLCIFLIMH